MIFTGDYLRQLLGEALEQVQSPANCAAVLEGSIAEGFGNDSSDIDFLLIDDSERSYPGTPTILFLDGRRVEMRLRSTEDIRADAKRLLHLGRGGRQQLARIPLALLNRCQRLSRAFPLVGEDRIDTIRSLLPEAELEAIVSRYFSHVCQQCARHTVVMLQLGETLDAVNWAQTTLTYGAKSWLASRGETYIEAKWVSQQIGRTRRDGNQIDRYLALETIKPPAREVAKYVREVQELLPGFEIEGCDFRPKHISLGQVEGVTTWQINARVHILRGRQEVFALSHEAAKVWRRIVFGTSLPDFLADLEGDHVSGGPMLAEFYHLGLVRLLWRGGGAIVAAPISTLIPSAERPILSLDGAVFATEDEPVKLLPIPAKRFAAAGMALGWANVMIENAREDAMGAVRREQWGVVEAVARRMVRQACLAVLSAHGVDPLPSQEQACGSLRRVPGLGSGIVEAALEVDRKLGVDGKPSAEAVLKAVEQLVRRTREVTGASHFPSSFVDADGWRATLETFYDWARIGAYLDSSFPLDDLRDVLVSVGDKNRQLRQETRRSRGATIETHA